MPVFYRKNLISAKNQPPQKRRKKMQKKTLFLNLTAAILISMFILGCFSGCGGGKEADLEISDYEFYIEKDKNDYVVNARGTVANKGDVDVRNLVITGYCKECSTSIVGNQWFVSDYEKMDHQKAVISHLASGASKNFEFSEVAYFSPRMGTVPEELPESLEISIESYEVTK
jgi:hypothetical protein